MPSKEIEGTFEKAFWKLELGLREENKEVVAASLCSIALNDIERKTPSPPRAMQRPIGQLKKRNDIVITKSDKVSGVVVMDRSDYVRPSSLLQYFH